MTTFLLAFAGSFIGAALGSYWMTARTLRVPTFWEVPAATRRARNIRAVSTEPLDGDRRA